MKYTGINYEVEPGKAVFFGSEVNRNIRPGQWYMKGFPAGDAIGAAFAATYCPVRSMRDVRRDILGCIQKAKRAGTGREMSMVLVYKTHALFLFAQGVLAVEDFSRELTEAAGSIDVPNVRFGRRRLTVRIVDNEAYFQAPVAADSDGNLI